MKKNRVSAFLLLVFCVLCFSSVTAHAAPSNPAAPQLSADELQFLSEKQTLRVSVVLDWRPFSYTEKDGVYKGLPVLILERLSAASGVALEFVPAQSYSRALAQLASGEVDMVGMLTEYPNNEAYSADGVALKLIPYLTSQTVLIHHKNTDLNTLPVVTLADIKGRFAFTVNKNVSTIYYASPQECVNAVRSGQADTMFCDVFTGSALMHRYNAKDLLSLPSTIMLESGFGVLPQTDARLISALEKTIAGVSRGDITRSLMDGSDYDAEGLFEVVYRYPFEIICFALSIMFVVILALTTYTKVNVRQHQALQGYEQSYRLLSDTFGEAGMEYDYQGDSLTIFGRHSNLDIDVITNNFKEKLRDSELRISLTAEMLDEMIQNGVDNKSFSAEFQCGVKSGEWVWYRLIYTVVCTTESHRRPIRLVGCLANIDHEHAEKEQLMKLSSNDQLTRLLNHTTGEKQVRSLLDRNTTSRAGLLIILDIDVFKQFNDQKGHLCGDKVLHSLGKAAQEIFAPGDILCRWGGDEFLFFLQAVPLETLTAQIELLRQRMRAFRYQNIACPVTLSIGGAQCFPGCTFASLFQQADDALYLAKKNGRDQFWMYSPTEQPPAAHGNEADHATQII